MEFIDRLERIPLYPKAETYEFGGELVKLASNETPWAPHPDVRAAIEAQTGNLNRYPDPANTRLRTALAERYDLAPEWIAVGNGSCEILLAAAQAMLEPGAEIVYAWPSFSMYPHLAGMSGARAVTVPLDPAGRHDLEAMGREVSAATRLVIVCNPNNPTGTALPVEAIGEFAASLPAHVALVIDEAYVEFNLTQDESESVELVRRHPNLVVLRTFSKVYGLCGLRAGYALGSPDFREAVDRVRQPFSVNMLVQAAATEALRHQDEVARRVERTVAARLAIEQGLDARGLRYSESQANFAWIDLGDRDEDFVVRALAGQGVIVRAGKHLGQEGFLRVTYGTEHENERFLAALDTAIGGRATTGP
ncbi:MAG: histidinol-phosphate transaminase [Thermoleophilaceae bacterium]|nr:histidinol-phosphate transaminase [Thermoleophilaceae bacterium]